MNAAGHALLRVKTDIVLHRAKIGQTQSGHLRTLPVLLEPTAVVPVHRQVKHQQPRNIRLRSLQFLLKIHYPDPRILAISCYLSSKRQKEAAIIQHASSVGLVTAPEPCSGLRSRPWRVPTMHGSRYTRRWSSPDPSGNRYAPASIPIRSAAWSNRSRNGGHGRDGP